MSKVEIVPAHLAVKAMRDNGYKNAAYAVAELMDNSIQAGARRVELLCIQRTDFVEQRSRQRIDRAQYSFAHSEFYQNPLSYRQCAALFCLHCSAASLGNYIINVYVNCSFMFQMEIKIQGPIL